MFVCCILQYTGSRSSSSTDIPATVILRLSLAMTSKSRTPRPSTIFPGSGGDYLDDISPGNSPAIPTGTLVKSGNNSGLIPLRLRLKYRSRHGNWIEGSPWSFYESVYRIELGGSLAGVYDLRTGKQFTLSSPSINEEQIRLLCQLNHRNLVRTCEIFRYQGVFYTISEHLAESLNQVIGCDKPLSKAQLASISGQVSYEVQPPCII